MKSSAGGRNRRYCIIREDDLVLTEATCSSLVSTTMAVRLIKSLVEVTRTNQNLLLATSMMVVSTVFVSVAVSYHLAMAGIKERFSNTFLTLLVSHTYMVTRSKSRIKSK